MFPPETIVVSGQPHFLLHHATGRHRGLGYRVQGRATRRIVIKLGYSETDELAATCHDELLAVNRLSNHLVRYAGIVTKRAFYLTTSSQPTPGPKA